MKVKVDVWCRTEKPFFGPDKLEKITQTEIDVGDHPIVFGRTVSDHICTWLTNTNTRFTEFFIDIIVPKQDSSQIFVPFTSRSKLITDGQNVLFSSSDGRYTDEFFCSPHIRVVYDPKRCTKPITLRDAVA